MAYDPNQPRDPAGVPTGGQWTDAGRAALAAAGLADMDLGGLLRKLQSGGFSQSLAGVSPKSGYMTALTTDTEMKKPVGDMTTDDIAEYLVQHQADLHKPDFFLGGWTDDDEGRGPLLAYLDVSKRFDDKLECLRRARDGNQKAIYDVVREKSIYLDKVKERY